MTTSFIPSFLKQPKAIFFDDIDKDISCHTETSKKGRIESSLVLAVSYKGYYSVAEL